jgi:P27 family predicted phage terminase small subunit
VRGTKPNLATDPKGMGAIPRPPVDLGKDAKAEWRRAAPLLVERRIITDGDLASLENYCAAIGAAREARRIVAREGMTFMGTSGPKRHPAVGIMLESMGVANRLAAELGLTPVSRSRPAIREDVADEDDGLDL